jgi:DNA mismatch repair protein MSH2
MMTNEQVHFFFSLDIMEHRHAIGCLQCLIHYLGLLEDEGNFGTFYLKSHDLKQYMRLDTAAVKAMNLFPTARDGSNKSMSLFGLLNHCRTSQGSRLLRQWISQPLLDVQSINRRLDFVQLFIEDLVLRESLLEEHLKRMPDFIRLSRKFQKTRAHLQDVVRLYQAIIRLPYMIQCLKSYEGQFNSLLEDYFITKLQVNYKINLL